MEFASGSGGASALNGLTDVISHNGVTNFQNSLVMYTNGSTPTLDNLTGSVANNIGIGNDVFKALTTGTHNVGIGNLSLDSVSSGQSNTVYGSSAGGAIDTGNNNTIIGYNAGTYGSDAITSGSNNTVIGYNASASAENATNEITLGNTTINALRCGVTAIASISDSRDKTNVTDSTYGLDFVDSLRPVQFTWQRRVLESSDENHSKNGKTRIGFLAQELQAAMPNNENSILDLVYESNPDRLEAKYGNLIPILTKAIQELSAANTALAARVTALENA